MERLHFKIQRIATQNIFRLGDGISSLIVRIGFFALPILLAIACNPKVQAPQLNRAQQIAIDSCAGVGIDLRQLTKQSVRSFVDCINGSDGRAQAYQDLLHAMPDADLEVLLQIYNRHMVHEGRFKKALQVYDQMQARGYLPQFLSAFAALIEAGVHRDLLPLLKDLYAAEGLQQRPAIEALNQLITSSIRKDDWTPLLLSLARFMDSGRARFLVRQMALADAMRPGYSSDRLVEDFSNALYYGIQSGGFKELSILLYDPVNLPMFRHMFTQTEGGLAGLNAYLEYLSSDANQNSLLQQLSTLTRALDQGMSCFASSGQSQNLDNLFALGLQEMRERLRHGPQALQDFYLREVPFHLQNLRYQCELPPELAQNYPAIVEIIAAGYGDSLSGLQLAFADFHRSEYLLRLLGSHQIHSFSRAIDAGAELNALAYLVDSLTQDWQAEDFRSINRWVMRLWLGEKNDAATDKWLQQQQGRMSRELYHFLQKSLQQQPRALVSLIDDLDAQAVSGDRQAIAFSAEIRLLLLQTDFPDSPAQEILPVLSRMSQPAAASRQHLQSLVRNLLALWRSDKLAVGDLFASMAATSLLSRDAPIQDFLADLLSDQDFVDSVNPVLQRWIDHPLFLQSLELTAALARSGEFSRLLAFFSDLSKPLALPELSPIARAERFQPFRGNPEDYRRSYHFVPKPTATDSLSCLQVLQQSSPWNSQYIMALARCFGETPDGEIYALLESLAQIEVDSERSVLDVLAGFVSQQVLPSAEFYPILSRLGEAFARGDLQTGLDFLASFEREVPGASENLQSLLRGFCASSQPMTRAQSLINIMEKIPASHSLSVLGLDLLFAKKDLALPAFEFLPMEYSDIDRQRNQQEWESWKQSLAPGTWQEDEVGYLQSIEYAYRHRTEEYFYADGLYPYPGNTSSAKKDFYLEFLLKNFRLLQRGDSLLALWRAISSLERDNFDWEGFFASSTRRTDLIPYYRLGERQAVARHASMLERAEILVQNSRLSVGRSIPVLGVDDVGSFFQLELAASKDLRKTLRSLRNMIRLGVTYSSVMGRREKWSQMKNIETNFTVLETWAEQGYLEFFARIYRELIAVTPRGDRVQDPQRNYAGLVHEPMRLALFAHISEWYQQLHREGLSDEFVTSLRWFAQLPEEEIRRLQLAIQKFYQLEVKQGFLTRLVRGLNNTASELSPWQWLNLWKAIRHFPRPGLALQWLVDILASQGPDSADRWAHWINHRLIDTDTLLAITGVIHNASDEEMQIWSLVFQELQRQPDWHLSLYAVLLRQPPETVQLVLRDLQQWLHLVRQDTNGYGSLRRTLSLAEPPLRPLLIGFLQSESNTEAASRFQCHLLERGEWLDFWQRLDRFRSSREFASIFEMLERHFSRRGD